MFLCGDVISTHGHEQCNSKAHCQVEDKNNGDAGHGASVSSAVAHTVNANSSTTTVASNLPTSAWGQAVRFRVTVSSSTTVPTGSAIVFVDGNSLGTCTLAAGICDVTTGSLSVGPHTVSATYTGNGNHLASDSATITQTVLQATTTTTITGSAADATQGSTVVYTVTVDSTTGTPTGTAQVYEGDLLKGSCTLAPVSATRASCGVPYADFGPGLYYLTGVFAGSTNFAPSMSTVDFAQNIWAPTTTEVTATTNPSAYFQNASFIVTVTSPLGFAAVFPCQMRLISVPV